MYKNYKIVCVTPAGRRRYMKLLAPYILSADIVDRWDIWVNTTNKLDISFFEFLSKNFQKVNLIPQPDGIINGNASINAFFRYCVEKDTIYIRFDDDIVWIEPNFFEKFIDFRIQNKQYFLVFPLIINNAICTHLLLTNQKIKILDYITANAFDRIAWSNHKFAQELHRWFLNILENNSYKKLYISDKPIALNRFSINCISWFGELFKEFNGIVLGDEEEYLTVIKPSELGLCNCIAGNIIASHFAFFTQRECLDKTKILDQYEHILEKTQTEKMFEIYDTIKKFKDYSQDDKTSPSGFSNWKMFKKKVAKMKIPVIKFVSIGEIYKYIKMKLKTDTFIITD